LKTNSIGFNILFVSGAGFCFLCERNEFASNPFVESVLCFYEKGILFISSDYYVNNIIE